MRAVSPYLRIPLVVFAALALVVAAPIHASHDHAGDPAQSDGPCVICKVLTTGAAWTAPMPLSPRLQPVGVLAFDQPVTAIPAPASDLVPRAPPLPLA